MASLVPGVRKRVASLVPGVRKRGGGGGGGWLKSALPKVREIAILQFSLK